MANEKPLLQIAPMMEVTYRGPDGVGVVESSACSYIYIESYSVSFACTLNLGPNEVWLMRGDFRYFMRLLTRSTQLWTEMVVDDTILHNLDSEKCERFLGSSV